MRRRIGIIAALAVLATLVAAPPQAHANSAVACRALTTANIVGARVTEAGPTTGTGHGYCRVRGTIAPQTTFELLLPAEGWQGQYVQEGCGGLCGRVELVNPPAAGYQCAAAADGRLALGATDGGHADPDDTDGSWARDSLALRTVFGLTSEHSLAGVARAVMAAFYGRPPAHSYFDGCSTGGRQALMLAQRFPADFDGIFAGAPAADLSGLGGMFNPWMIQHNTDPHGRPVLTADKLPALHAAVLARCGNADRVVADPRRCDFDPASIRCPAGTDTASCPTPAQVGAVQAFYSGPVDLDGHRLYAGGQAYGSELGWSATFLGDPPPASWAARISLSYLADLAYLRNPPADFTLADVRFTRAELRRLNVLGDAIYDATDPDLRAFRAHGGKLILYHGTADPAVPVTATIGYYGAVERAAGGFVASQVFSRLYVIPGGHHCLVGPGFAAPDEIALAELLSPLIAWVEQGTPPGEEAAPILPLTDAGQHVDQTVLPFDALR
ncbi:MAG TPA: tannase/feruloyl esterase family alpha/beta hydrolase [Asanoa sp.]